MSLSNTTVAITGAGGGLGKAIAESYLEAGANVAICDTDITDEAAFESFVDSVVSKFGKLDILVNNAGLMDTFDPVGTTSKAVWDRIISVNLTGLFIATKVAVNAMLKTNGGTIINIGSNASEHAGFYGSKGIYSIALLLGGMEDTNIVDNFRVAGMNQEAYGQIQAANPGYVPGKTKIELRDAAKYCVFLADRAVAQASNGSTMTVNKNWPYA